MFLIIFVNYKSYIYKLVIDHKIICLDLFSNKITLVGVKLAYCFHKKSIFQDMCDFKFSQSVSQMH